MKRPPVSDRSVLITGCSSGIGKSTAALLKAEGWKVYAAARKDADLEMLSAEGYTPIQLDVSSESSIQTAAKAVLHDNDGKLGGLVNNAGLGITGAMEDLSWNAMSMQMNVNTIGMQLLSNQFIPAFRQAGNGRIVNISSVLGRVSIPFAGMYCASKFAMEAMSDAMRMEVRAAGIGVSLIEPGPIQSQFRPNAAALINEHVDTSNSAFKDYYASHVENRLLKNHDDQPFMLPPEAVAKKIRHALVSGNPRRRYCVTVPAYGGAWLRRLAPYSVLDWLCGRRLNS